MRQSDDPGIVPGSSFLGSIDRVRSCSNLCSLRLFLEPHQMTRTDGW